MTNMTPYSPMTQTMSRNEKKDIKRRTADASRLDNFNDIGDIGEFEEIAELSKSINKSKKSSSSDVFLEEGEIENTEVENTQKYYNYYTNIVHPLFLSLILL